MMATPAPLVSIFESPESYIAIAMPATPVPDTAIALKPTNFLPLPCLGGAIGAVANSHTCCSRKDHLTGKSNAGTITILTEVFLRQARKAQG
jgi:hypothetical protein